MCLQSSKVHCLHLAQRRIWQKLSLCCDHSYSCLGFVLDLYQEFRVLTSRKTGLILLSPSCWMSWCTVCSCRVGVRGFRVGSHSPPLRTRSLLGRVSRRTPTEWTTWTHHLNTPLACGRFCGNLSSLCVCLAFFLSSRDAVSHRCFTRARILFCSDTCRWLPLPNSRIRAHCIAEA